MKRSRLKERRRIIKRRKQARDIIYIFLVTAIIIGLNNKVLTPFAKHMTSLFPVHAQTVISPLPSKTVTPTPTNLPTRVQVQYADKRISALTHFLEAHNSPLADYAAYIIDQSDANGIDWTLLTAISGKESGYCKYIPNGSFNCWGLGGARNMMYFSGFQDAIAYEAQLLGNYYRENAIGGIQSKYCPSYECDPNWTSDVTSFSQEMLAQK